MKVPPKAKPLTLLNKAEVSKADCLKSFNPIVRESERIENREMTRTVG
jgi:hypothetical protein